MTDIPATPFPRGISIALATVLYLLGGVLLLVAVRRTADFYFLESLVVSVAIAMIAAARGRPAWEAACLALALPVCTAVSSYALPATIRIWPTLDRDLELLTRSLTGADGLAPVRWGHRHPHLRTSLEWTYDGLMVGMAVAWVRDHFRRRLILWLVLSAGVGFALYHLTPAAGPSYVRPDGGLSEDAWRNAVPSLHFTEALYAAAVVWSYGAGWRAAGIAFAALTAAATVVGGQHYAVDLVATVPFALAIPWIAAGHWRGAVPMALLVALWTVALRQHLLLELSPAAIRLLAAVTVLVPFFMLRATCDSGDRRRVGGRAAVGEAPAPSGALPGTRPY